MASAEVVYDVGVSLQKLLRGGIPESVVSDVVLSTPERFESLPDAGRTTLTIFLYRVSVSSELRNSPMRTLPDGRTLRPPLPIELRYLITPWAATPDGEHVMAGHVMRVLYEHAEVAAPYLLGGSWRPHDSVQVILETLPIEDHTRIWDTVDKPYRLSLTYLVRVAGIDPEPAQTASVPVVDAQLGGVR